MARTWSGTGVPHSPIVLAVDCLLGAVALDRGHRMASQLIPEDDPKLAIRVKRQLMGSMS